jgi:hypothetical protein
MYSEDDVLAAYDFFLEQWRKKPWGTKKLPTRQEVINMMKRETILYVKEKDGSFKPVWIAEDIDD